ncbi:FAD1 flavin adenine dinucleotide synthetase, partial [Irineochytrium annulatum]
DQKVTKHIKPNPQNPRGDIIAKESPIHYTNVMLVDPILNKVKIEKRFDKSIGRPVQQRYFQESKMWTKLPETSKWPAIYKRMSGPKDTLKALVLEKTWAPSLATLPFPAPFLNQLERSRRNGKESASLTRTPLIIHQLSARMTAAVFSVFNGQPMARKVESALDVIRDCIRRYGVEGTALSFNGGKDCTVMLHQLSVVLDEHYAGAGRGAKRKPTKTLYVACADPFEEVEQFVKEEVERCDLDLTRIEKGMKSALEEFLAVNVEIKAVLIGTRRTDPYCEHLEPFLATDADWPQVMRVHPILDWDYGDIWRYLIDLKIPYCSLYDAGYTSLGGISNTIPNPVLKNNARPGGYDSAYALTDGSKERDGRLKK